MFSVEQSDTVQHISSLIAHQCSPCHKGMKSAYVRVYHCFSAASEVSPRTVHCFVALLTTVLVCCKHLKIKYIREKNNLSGVQRCN
jgi:hypothetical protein